MPSNIGRTRRFLAGILAAAMGVGGASAQAQTIPLSDLLNRLNPNLRAAARPGQATEAEGGPVAQAAVGQTAEKPRAEPFGASLFAGGSMPVSDAVNPDYVVQPGDRIGINLLGGPGGVADGVTAPAPSGGTPLSLIVDPQGNIVLPEVGPVHVGGVRADALQGAVQQQVGRTFTSRVSVYAVLLTAHRVGIYVAGFVTRPGRYAGTASDTVLDYLVRSGGVDPSRGSYRDIAVIRRGATVAHVDLYDFLLTGKTPDLSLREGDTIFVAKQNAMVEVEGAARNNYLFELTASQTLGSEIVALARPLPSATHAVLSGSRDNKPFSSYLPLADFARTPVFDQDQVSFVGDKPSNMVRVRIEGSRLGPSYLVLPNDSTLPAVLSQISVDPGLADLGSAYVLRKSIAEQQTRVINEAMDRLERALYLAVSPTSGVSAIRSNEAQMISSYIQRARRTPPDGRLVVTDESGRPADVRLEDDDVIVIPRKSQVVMVSGEVLAPQAVLFQPGLTREDYVKMVGGYSERGRKGRFLIHRSNGALILDSKAALRPGDEVTVLPYIDPKFFQLGTDVLSLFYQIAVAASVATNL